MKILILFVLLTLILSINCDNFLILHPFYSGSHVLTLHSITEQLINRGHHVTTVRFLDTHNLKLKPMGINHTEIYLNFNNSDGHLPFVSVEEKGKFEMPLDLLWNQGLAITTLFRLPSNPWALVDDYCKIILGNKEFIERLRDQNFNLAIVDLVYNECGLALAHHLNLPTVGYWAFSFSNGECEFPAVSTPPSHIPCFMSELTDVMNFQERVYNMMLKLFSRFLMTLNAFFVDGYINRDLKNIPGSNQLLANINGALINTDFILDYPRLQAPTMINIGGMQIHEKPKPLPPQIQNWIDGAEHGIVLFTMGFIFNPKVVPKQKIDDLLNAFARLPQRVIVKFEKPIENAPSNVLILPFLPQQDILAHPKTKVFFTHCGMHGVMESIYHSVPMVGMPVFIDQGDVAVRMEQKGIVERLDKSATEDDIYNAIVKVRDNPK